MKRLITAGLLLAALLPAAAWASAPTAQHRGEYARLYHRVAQKLGKRAPGRNIARDGLASGRAAGDADLVRSITILERMLAPPPASAPAPTASSAAVPQATGYSAPVTSSGG